MAATQKKSVGKRKSTASNKTRSTQSARTSASTGSRAKKPTQTKPQGRPIRREVGAAVCLVLAVFSALGYFNIDALFINAFCGLLKGLLGYGYYVVPPVLALAFYILAFHRGRPVRLRLSCALALSAMPAILLHVFIVDKGAYSWSWQMIGQLWKDGQNVDGGGVICGFLAEGGRSLFSAVGTAIVVVLITVALCLVAFNRSIGDIVEYIRNHPRAKYSEPEVVVKAEPAPAETVRVPETVSERPAGGRRAIDVPLDGEVVVEAEKPEKPRKEGFFNRKPNVKSPDQVLMEGEEPKQEVAIAAKPSKTAKPAPMPIDLDEGGGYGFLRRAG